MKKIARKILSIFMVAVMVGFMPIFNGKSYAAEVGLTVKTHTKDEIKAKLKNVNLNKSVGYKEQPVTKAPYKVGRLDDDTLNSALYTLNTVRYIAGLNDGVIISESYNEKVQAGALLNFVNNELSHYPTRPSDMDEDIFTLGEEGASSANIAFNYGNLNRAIVDGWLADSDEYNIDTLGHRRWILYPGMKKTGFGQVGAYNAMYAFDGYGRYSDRVAWPAQITPINYFNDTDAWSLSLGNTANKDSVSVTLTNKNTGKTFKFNSKSSDGYFNVENNGYGQPGCVIFRPNDISYKDGDMFNVKVDIEGKDSITYDVEFFDPNKVEVEKNTITFDAANGTSLVKKEVNKGDKLDFTPQTPIKEGYSFVGWYLDTDDINTQYKSGTTYTQNVTYKAKWAHFEMLGAQGKSIVDEKSGIRFGTKVFNDGDEIIERGTLMLPSELIKEGEIITLETNKVAKSICKVLYETNESENSFTYLGTLVNIPKNQFAKKIAAASYVTYKDKAGNTYTVYSQYKNGSVSVNDLLNL